MSARTIKSKNHLEHLKFLVGFDTQNPPRKITVNSDIFEYLKKQLNGFDFSMLDSGEGCISLLAVRGKPKLLFNFHIDTVPITEGWNSNPLELIVNKEKAIGLGACDIKGASACMLSAASKTKGDLALLFSSDEEHGSSMAIKHFLQTAHGFKQVIVAEPTQAQAILAHRGIQTAKATFTGVSGHASEARAFTDNAIHQAGSWISSTLSWVKNQTQSFETLSGLPFNIGKIEGGIKANMIAANCELTFGFRPLPGQDSKKILAQLTQLGIVENHFSLKQFELVAGFFGATLPAANQDFDSAINNAELLAKKCQLPIGNAVNFWTEASLFSQAGLTALVYGSGNIKQAHTANEWVSLEQLQQVEQAYIGIIELI